MKPPAVATLYENLVRLQSDTGIGLALVRGLKIVYADPALCNLVMRTEDELKLLSGVLELVVPEEREAFLAEPGAIDETTPSRLATLLRKDGARAPVEFSSRTFLLDGEQHVFCLFADVTERRRNEEQILWLANHDPLTGLANQLLLRDRMHQTLTRLKRHGGQAAVLFLDLDRFKVINDTLGHRAGDRLIRAVAERLKARLRESDTVCRLGGDEFVIMLDDVGGSRDIAIVAEKVLATFSKPFQAGENELFITASIGISVFPDDGTDAETLLKHADTAMYRAKEGGRNGFSLYDPVMNKRALRRLTLEDALRRALERNELTLQYQPQLELGSLRIIGMEALLRWNSKELGAISPGEFISLAEETGLILPIGEWVLATACAQNAAWQAAGLLKVKVAMNISARQLQQHGFLEGLTRHAERSGLDKRYIELELTETILMENVDTARRVLGGAHELGMQAALDDFGTGYSSLSYLKQLPFTTLKVDRSFVQGITSDAKDRSITAAIITLGHNLSMRVLAEAVETPAQLRVLEDLGCDELQGFLFSPAVSAEKAGQLLAQGTLKPLQEW